MLGFIVAIGAGFIVPHLEAPLGRPVAKFLSKHITLEATETRLISFVIAMLGAGIAAALLDSGTMFWMTLGGALGYFGARLVAAGKTAMDARKIGDKMDDAADAVEDKVDEAMDAVKSDD